MATEYTLEIACREDMPAVKALLQVSDLPLDDLDNPAHLVIVARNEGGIIGTAALEFHGGDALLRSVSVEPKLRGKGLGVRLTRAALIHAQENAARAVYLLTETAEPFFRNQGFRVIPRESVSDAMHNSVEFKSVCPVSATAMVREI